jgi:hypothetical protein
MARLPASEPWNYGINPRFVTGGTLLLEELEYKMTTRPSGAFVLFDFFLFLATPLIGFPAEEHT